MQCHYFERMGVCVCVCVLKLRKCVFVNYVRMCVFACRIGRNRVNVPGLYIYERVFFNSSANYESPSVFWFLSWGRTTVLVSSNLLRYSTNFSPESIQWSSLDIIFKSLANHFSRCLRPSSISLPYERFVYYHLGQFTLSFAPIRVVVVQIVCFIFSTLI